MAYTKTSWDENTAITPARLNNLESQYEKAMAVAVTEAKPSVTYYVNAATGNDNNDGLSSNKALKTISKALDKAQKVIAGEITIEIAPGTYNENVSIKRIAAPITLEGEPDEEPLINGSINIDSTLMVILYGLKSTHSVSNITCLNGSAIVKIISCILTTQYGMGIELKHVGAVEIEDCVISAGVSGARLSAVGAATIESTNFSLGATGIAAIEMLTATTAYTRNLTGDIADKPVHQVVASILFKGSSTITGGADEKSHGGQIFS